MVRRWVIVLVTLLVLSAGCSAPISSDGSVDSPTGTTATGSPADSDASGAPYQSLSNASTVVDTHRDRLREAGTVVRHFDELYVEEDSEGTERTQRERTARIDFGTDPASRLVETSDATYWRGPEHDLERSGSPPEFERYEAGPGVFTYGLGPDRFEFFEFSAPERIKRDGETLFRYSVTGVEDANNVTVRNASGQMLLRPDGLVRSARLHIFVDTGSSTYRSQVEFEYRKVGQISVTRPSWYDDAVEAAGPFRDDIVTARLPAPDLNASITMTGPAGVVSPEFNIESPIRRPAVRRMRNEVVNGARASCIVRVARPPGVENATLSLNYSESLVPSGEEENLSLVREDDRRNTLVPVEDAVVDTSRNVATVPVTTEEVYLVMHMPTFRQAFDRDTPRVAADATGVPECGA